MKAALKATGDEHAPYRLLLRGETELEQKVLQAWVSVNPLGESISTSLGWVRIRVLGASPPKELHSEYLSELTKPQRIEAMQIRQVLREREQAIVHHAQRFERAVASSRPRIRDWVDAYREARQARRKKKKKGKV